MSKTSKRNQKVYDRHGMICYLCKVKLTKFYSVAEKTVWRKGRRTRRMVYMFPDHYATIDHVVARVRGGSSEQENLRPCCQKCNVSKGRRNLKEQPSKTPEQSRC